MSKAQKFLQDSQDLFEMSNLPPRDTNLPVIVWVSQKGFTQHGPRVKVMTHTGKMNIRDTVPVSISNSPRVLEGDLDSKYFELVKKWIIMNKDILMQYWNEEIYTADLINGIKKI